MTQCNESNRDQPHFMPYVNNQSADQPALPYSRSSTFIVRCLDSLTSIDSIPKIPRLASFCSWACWFDSCLFSDLIIQLFSWCYSLNLHVIHFIQFRNKFDFTDIHRSMNAMDHMQNKWHWRLHGNFAWNPLRLYFDECQKNEIHLLYLHFIFSSFLFST